MELASTPPTRFNPFPRPPTNLSKASIQVKTDSTCTSQKDYSFNTPPTTYYQITQPPTVESPQSMQAMRPQSTGNQGGTGDVQAQAASDLLILSHNHHQQQHMLADQSASAPGSATEGSQQQQQVSAGPHTAGPTSTLNPSALPPYASPLIPSQRSTSQHPSSNASTPNPVAPTSSLGITYTPDVGGPGPYYSIAEYSSQNGQSTDYSSHDHHYASPEPSYHHPHHQVVSHGYMNDPYTAYQTYDRGYYDNQRYTTTPQFASYATPPLAAHPGEVTSTLTFSHPQTPELAPSHSPNPTTIGTWSAPPTNSRKRPCPDDYSSSIGPPGSTGSASPSHPSAPPRKAFKSRKHSKAHDMTVPPPVITLRDGIEWLTFAYRVKGQIKSYTIRIDIDAVDTNLHMDDEFKQTNCVYPRAFCAQAMYTGNRWQYETECNQMGWKFAWLNKEELAGKRGLIQRAVDSYRNRYPELRSRRVIRQEKLRNGTLRKRQGRSSGNSSPNSNLSMCSSVGVPLEAGVQPTSAHGQLQSNMHMLSTIPTPTLEDQPRTASEYPNGENYSTSTNNGVPGSADANNLSVNFHATHHHHHAALNYGHPSPTSERSASLDGTMLGGVVGVQMDGGMVTAPSTPQEKPAAATDGGTPWYVVA